MQQVEAKRIDLDAPIRTDLRDDRVDTGERVTVRRLLQRKSGLPEGVETWSDIADALAPGGR